MEVSPRGIGRERLEEVRGGGESPRGIAYVYCLIIV